MMPEFPRELIRQVQISTRSAAGLSRYDPSDPTPPTPPSISDAIADLELSPTQLRCEHCKGGLLRGLLSNICVYCGARCRADVTPEPIFFNSTIGYRWLLRSLNLDGSEIVKPLTNKNDQDQGQSSQKPDIPLSDFLNFRIALSSQKEKQDRIASGQRSEENNGFSHLDRVAPDNFFFRSTGDRKQVGTTRVKEVTALENQNLFQGIQSSVPTARGNIDKPVDEFSGWEADFQSGVSENQHGISTFSDDFVGGSDSQESTRDSKLSHLTNVELDLSSHFDSVFGDKNNVIQGKPTDHVVAFPAWDLTSEDVLPHTSSNESQLVEGFNVTEKSNDLNISADIFQDFELPNNDTNMLGSQKMTGDKDESLEVKVSDKLSITEDNNMVEISAEPPSVDLFKDFQWQTNGADIVSDRRVNEEQGSINQSHLAEDFFDTSADNLSTEANLFQDFKWQTEDDDDKKVNNLQASVSVESFDEWNDFTGSTGLQDPFTFSGIQNDNLFIHQEESSDVDLFSPNTKLEVSSFQPPLAPTAGFDDIFSNNPSNRLSDGSGKPTTTGDEVKMLISQMDDLSFMLKSDLCIPSASNSDKPLMKDR